MSLMEIEMVPRDLANLVLTAVAVRVATDVAKVMPTLAIDATHDEVALHRAMATLFAPVAGVVGRWFGLPCVVKVIDSLAALVAG